MSRAFFFSAGIISLGGVLLAWHWRSERFAAGEREQRAAAMQAAVPLRPAPAAPPVAPVKPPPVTTEPSRAEFFEAMLPEASEARRARNPKLQSLYVRKLRLELLLKNGPFFRSLHLSAEERERLLAAWVGRDLTMIDVRAVSRELGLPLSAPAVETVASGANQEAQAAELAVLGADGAKALADYRRVQPMRDFVTRIVGEATLAGAPLTADQADALTAVLVHSRTDRPVYYINQVDLAAVERLLPDLVSPQQLDLVLLPLRGQVAAGKLSAAVHAAQQADKGGP